MPAGDPETASLSRHCLGLRMKPSRTHLLAMLLVASGCHAADIAPSALSKKLASIAGLSARDCGSIPQGSDRGAAIACAKDATTSGTAYRLAVQLEGADSSIWQGAVRDGDGKFWVVFYEADLSGGPGAGPTMSVLLCSEIQFMVKGSDAMECQPILGEP